MSTYCIWIETNFSDLVFKYKNHIHHFFQSLFLLILLPIHTYYRPILLSFFRNVMNTVGNSVQCYCKILSFLMLSIKISLCKYLSEFKGIKEISLTSVTKNLKAVLFTMSQVCLFQVYTSVILPKKV